MSSSPRPLSTISVAAIVLSATLSVLLSTDHSFAQSTTNNATQSNPLDIASTRPPIVHVVCKGDQTREIRECQKKCSSG